jgi:hypothetical protein
VEVECIQVHHVQEECGPILMIIPMKLKHVQSSIQLTTPVVQLLITITHNNQDQTMVDIQILLRVIGTHSQATQQIHTAFKDIMVQQQHLHQAYHADTIVLLLNHIMVETTMEIISQTKKHMVL